MPLGSELIPPPHYFKRSYGFQVFDAGQYAGVLGLNEVRDVKKPFTTDMFLVKKFQGKGVAPRRCKH